MYQVTKENSLNRELSQIDCCFLRLEDENQRLYNGDNRKNTIRQIDGATPHYYRNWRKPNALNGRIQGALGTNEFLHKTGATDKVTCKAETSERGDTGIHEIYSVG